MVSEAPIVASNETKLAVFDHTFIASCRLSEVVRRHSSNVVDSVVASV